MNGTASFVIPSHKNIRYIDIDPGESIGVLDIAGEQFFNLNRPGERSESIKRHFSIMTTTKSVVLQLTKEDLILMKQQYPNSYYMLMKEQFDLLFPAWVLKQNAIQVCRHFRRTVLYELNY